MGGVEATRHPRIHVPEYLKNEKNEYNDGRGSKGNTVHFLIDSSSCAFFTTIIIIGGVSLRIRHCMLIGRPT